MELTFIPRASHFPGFQLAQGRPYTPPPQVLPDAEGASSSVTTQTAAVRSGEGEGEVVLQPEVPRRLAQAMLEVVVIDSPGGTPSPSFVQPASPVPVHEEEEDMEPGAPVEGRSWGSVRERAGSYRDDPGASVVWHERLAAARDGLADNKSAGGIAQPVVVGQPIANPGVAIAVVEPAVPHEVPLAGPLVPAGPGPGVQPFEIAGNPIAGQGFCEKLGIGLKVGIANAARELAAGTLGAVTQVAVTQGMRSAAVAGGVSGGAGIVGLMAGSTVASFLVGKTISRLAGQPELKCRHVYAGLALAGGFVPFAVTQATAGSAKAALNVYHQFLGRLAGAFMTESFMQLLDGALPRARLVAPAVEPLEPAPSLRKTLWARHMIGAHAYVGLGGPLEGALGPGVGSALGARGLSPEAAQAVVGTLMEPFFAVWDGVATAVSADSDNLALVLEPGDVRALSRNLCRLGDTLSRIADFSGARVLASSPLDFLNIGLAMDPGDRGLEAFQVLARHLSRLRGYLQQEGRTPAGTFHGVASDFLAAHDAFLGSAGAGIDLRAHPPVPAGEPDDLV